MKKTIPAGTPGTFRPDYGQYPEPDARIDLWLNTAKGQVRIQSVGRNLPANPAAYAWSYAPTPPPVDGFEAFCAGFTQDQLAIAIDFRRSPLGYATMFLDEPEGYAVAGNGLASTTRPTLEAAQHAAYEHFLASLQDAP